MLDHFSPFWANSLLILDFETSSPDPETCYPVQLAAVLLAGEDGREFSTLINPGVPIPEEATAVHGITDADVQGAPTPAVAIAQLVDWLGDVDAIPCAYNASFDRTVLFRWAAATTETLRRPWLDPLVMVRGIDRWVPGKGRHKLEATCKRWGIDLDNAHDALSDARACGHLLMAMKRRLGNRTYSELIRGQRIRAAEQEKDFAEYIAEQERKEKVAAESTASTEAEADWFSTDKAAAK